MFDDKGKLYSYEEFLNDKSFPVKYNKYASVITAIPSGIIELMKCHLNYQNVAVQRNCLKLGGMEITNIKFTNKHIRTEIQKCFKIFPKGNFSGTHIWKILIGVKRGCAPSNSIVFN